MEEEYNKWITFYDNLYSRKNIEDIINFANECKYKHIIVKSLITFYESNKQVNKDFAKNIFYNMKDIIEYDNECLEDETKMNYIHFKHVGEPLYYDQKSSRYIYDKRNIEFLRDVYNIYNFAINDDVTELMKIEKNQLNDVMLHDCALFGSVKCLRYLLRNNIKMDTISIIESFKNTNMEIQTMIENEYRSLLKECLNSALSVCVENHNLVKLNRLREMYPRKTIISKECIIDENWYEYFTDDRDSLSIIKYTNNIVIFKFHYMKSIKLYPLETKLKCMKYITTTACDNDILGFLLPLYYNELDIYHKLKIIEILIKDLKNGLIIDELITFFIMNEKELFNIYDCYLSDVSMYYICTKFSNILDRTFIEECKNKIHKWYLRYIGDLYLF